MRAFKPYSVVSVQSNIAFSYTYSNHHISISLYRIREKVVYSSKYSKKSLKSIVISVVISL